MRTVVECSICYLTRHLSKVRNEVDAAQSVVNCPTFFSAIISLVYVAETCLTGRPTRHKTEWNGKLSGLTTVQCMARSVRQICLCYQMQTSVSNLKNTGQFHSSLTGNRIPPLPSLMTFFSFFLGCSMLGHPMQTVVAGLLVQSIYKAIVSIFFGVLGLQVWLVFMIDYLLSYVCLFTIFPVIGKVSIDVVSNDRSNLKARSRYT